MKQSAKGNYFQIWLQEYKARLQQVSRESTFNASGDDAQATGIVEEIIRNEGPAHPAEAGELFFLSRQTQISRDYAVSS